jgi:hypothetical protein
MAVTAYSGTRVDYAALSGPRTIERERRWAVPAALACFVALALLVVALVVQGGAAGTTRTTSEFLGEFADDRSTLLGSSAVRAAGIALLIAPLLYLFRAAAARNPAVRQGLVGLVFAGPLFLAGAEIAQWVAFDNAAAEFARPGGGAGIPVGEYAEDLITEQTAFGIAQGLSFGGTVGFVVAMIYTALQAMRVGLLTRFHATLGMALSAAVVLIAQVISLLVIGLWFVWLGLVILGRVPRGRPPAWDAGIAVPWPSPGEEAEEPEEPAVEGEGRELAGEGEESPHAERRERARKKKRKRR